MSDFTPIETQEQFDARISDRLARDRKTYAKQFQEDLIAKGWKSPEELETLTADYVSQIDALKNAAAETEKIMAAKDAEIAEGAKYRTDLAKTRIALNAGLRLEFADRLKGETEEEWKKDAESLAKYMAPAVPSAAPLGNPEAGGGSSATRDQFASWFSQKTNQ